MKLYTFEMGGQRRVGAEWDRQLVDLTATYNALLATSEPKPGQLRAIPTEMLSFVRLGRLALDAASDAVAFIKKRPAVPVGEQLVYPFDSVKLLAPIPRPGKILCAEISLSSQNTAHPIFFAKLPGTVIGPSQPIIKPHIVEELDHTVALAAVVGKPMKSTPETEAISSIFGYTILYDISARNIAVHESQPTLRKNFDTFCPLGPCLLTADQLPDLSNLRLTSFLNGSLVQEVAIAECVSQLPPLLSFLSSVMTLEPGDILSISGARADPGAPASIRPGDTLSGGVDAIGHIENPVGAESVRR